MYFFIYSFSNLKYRKTTYQYFGNIFCTSASSNRLPTKRIEWFKILLAKRNSPEQFGLDGDFLGPVGKHHKYLQQSDPKSVGDPDPNFLLHRFEGWINGGKKNNCDHTG
jgi:hypothetical protein